MVVIGRYMRRLLAFGLWTGLACGLALQPSIAMSAAVLPAKASFLLKNADGTVPDRLGGFVLVTAFAEDWGFRFLFTLDQTRPDGVNLVEFLLTARDESTKAIARTASFNVGYKGPTEGGDPAARVRPLVDELLATLQRNDDGGAVLGPPPGSSARPADQPSFSPLTESVKWLGILLVVLFLLASPVTAGRLYGDLRSALGPAMWPVLAVVVVGIAARILVPHRPVMYYMGYRMAEVAAALDDIPKYGPGALALYHMLFRLTGPSHLVMAGLNAVLGGLLPLAAAALVARLRGGRIAVAAAAVLIAVTPVFVRDSASESLLVPTLLWTATGLWLIARWRATGGASDLLLALLHLSLAVFSRPESVGLVPLAAVALLPFGIAARGSAPKLRRPFVVGVVAACAILLGLRIAHLWTTVGRELDLGNTPVLADPGSLLWLLPGLVTRNLALRPEWFPVGVSLVAVLPIIAGPRRLRGIVLLALASAWLAVSLVDLPQVSMPRVQVPGLFFVVIAAAFGLEAAWVQRGKGTAGRSIRLAFGILAVMVVVASVPFSAAAFVQQTNADDEEDLLVDAVAALPDGPVVFVRHSWDDQPVEPLHLYYPDYWFMPPFRDDLVLGPDRLAVTDTGERPVFFLLGTRCWLRSCGQEGMHPACRRMVDAYDLRPVIERKVPVRRIPLDRDVPRDGDLDFPWCVSAHGSMTIGLYRAYLKNPPAQNQAGQ